MTDQQNSYRQVIYPHVYCPPVFPSSTALLYKCIVFPLPSCRPNDGIDPVECFGGANLLQINHESCADSGLAVAQLGPGDLVQITCVDGEGWGNGGPSRPHGKFFLWVFVISLAMGLVCHFLRSPFASLFAPLSIGHSRIDSPTSPHHSYPCCFRGNLDCGAPLCASWSLVCQPASDYKLPPT